VTRALLAPLGLPARVLEVEPSIAAYGRLLGATRVRHHTTTLEFDFFVDAEAGGKGLEESVRLGQLAVRGPVLFVGRAVEGSPCGVDLPHGTAQELMAVLDPRTR